MIAFIYNGKAVGLPAIIDVRLCNAFTIVGKYITDIQCAYANVIRRPNTNTYDITIRNAPAESVLTITESAYGKTKTYDIKLYNDDVSYTTQASWLDKHQLSYLTVLSEVLHYSKTKEGALYAKYLYEMQGTEGGLALLRRLMQLPDELVINRIWQNDNKQAYDEMHNVRLASKGYTLTNELFAQYNATMIDPWNNLVLPIANELQLPMHVVYDILSKYMPASLHMLYANTNTHGLGSNYLSCMSMSNIMVKSMLNIGRVLTIADRMQYETADIQYDCITNVVLKKVQGIHMTAATMHIKAEQPVQDIVISADGSDLSRMSELSGEVELLTMLPVGEHTIDVAYRHSGNYITDRFAVTVYPESTNIQMYALAYEGEPAYFVGSAKLMHDYMSAIRFKSLITLQTIVPKPYQLFYVPYENSIVAVSDGISIKQYDLSTLPDMPDFSVSLQSLSVNGLDRMYWQLYSKTYMGTYDYTVQYLDNGWHYAKQECRYLTGDTMPSISKLTLSLLDNDRQPCSINGKAIANGQPMPFMSDNKAFLADIFNFANVQLNDYAVICYMSDKLTIDYGDKHIEDVARKASYKLKSVKQVSHNAPLIVYAPGKTIDTYVKDSLIKTETDVAVVMKHRHDAYELRIHTDKFSKTIQL